MFELVSEAYLDQHPLTDEEIQRGIEDGIRGTFAYLVKIDRAVLLAASQQSSRGTAHHWGRYRITDLFDLKRGNFHSIERLDAGQYPTISRIGADNGFVGFFNKPEKAKEWPSKTITVSSVTGDSFVQPVPFIATDNVVLCVPKSGQPHYPLPTLFFIQRMLNAGKWRYSYGRQPYGGKFAVTEIMLPITDSGELDHLSMASFVQSATYWPLVRAAFDTPSN